MMSAIVSFVGYPTQFPNTSYHAIPTSVLRASSIISNTEIARAQTQEHHTGPSRATLVQRALFQCLW